MSTGGRVWQGRHAWQGGMHDGGHAWQGVYVAGGHAWQGSMHGGHMWQGACIAGGVLGGVWWWGMHGRGSMCAVADTMGYSQ